MWPGNRSTPVVVAATLAALISCDAPRAGAQARARTSTSQPLATSEPELPRSWVDSTYDPPVGGSTHLVRSDCDGVAGCFDDLQAALDAALPGDVIEVEAGARFTGNFILRTKPGDGWVYVRSSGLLDLPKPGVRVSPGDSLDMPTIVSPNAAPTLAAEFGAHHYRFVGLRITTSSSLNYNLALFGRDALETENEARQESQLPSDIIFDRCYIHGNPTGEIRRGILFDVRRGAVVDSYLSDFHQVGFDTQAIASFNGAGPFSLINNYFEAAGENVMFGGMAPAIDGLVPSDIEVRSNHCFKPLRWKRNDRTYAGREWTVKNLFELKNARRVVVDGNVFENNWAQAQNGCAVLFTPRSHGPAAWSTVEDVRFTRNVVTNSDHGFLILAEDDQTPSGQARRILIHENVVEARGTFFQLVSSYLDGPGRPILALSIMNNTCVHDGVGESILVMTNWPRQEGVTARVVQDLVVRGNLLSHGAYGVHGSGAGVGVAALRTFVSEYEFADNVLYGELRNRSENYPPFNVHLEHLAEVGFVDFARGDYRLRSRLSPVVGADVNTLQQMEECVRRGNCKR